MLLIADDNTTLKHNDTTDTPDFELQLAGAVDFAVGTEGAAVTFVIRNGKAAEISRVSY